MNNGLKLYGLARVLLRNDGSGFRSDVRKTSLHVPCKSRTAGYTLLELVVVIIMLGLMSYIAVGNMYSPGEMSLPSQARKMASDIDKAKLLAFTTGAHLRVTIPAGANGTYTVNSCILNGSGVVTSCPTTVLSGSLEKGVGLVAPDVTFDFNSWGQPSNTAALNFTLSSCPAGSCPSSTTTEAILVEALTGRVTVTP